MPTYDDEVEAEPLDAKDVEAIKRVGSRFPASEVASTIPPGCTMRAYEAMGGTSPCGRASCLAVGGSHRLARSPSNPAAGIGGLPLEAEIKHDSRF